MTTRYQKHCQRWRDCAKCSLYTQRKQVVLAGGIVPAPILFIGEAPGESENVIGRPFVGPAGKLLHQIIDEVVDGQYNYAFTNLIACIPKDEQGNKVTEPSEESIKACAIRLQEFVSLCQPKLIVRVGKLAEKWVKEVIGHERSEEYYYRDIIHPAAILRSDISQQGLAIQRATVALEDAVAFMEELEWVVIPF